MSKINKFLLKNKIFIILFFTIIYFEPQLFKENYYNILVDIDYVYKILKLIGFFIIAYFYFIQIVLKNDKRKNISLFLVTMICFQAVCALSTIINNGLFTRFIGPALTTIYMVMACDILIYEHNFFFALEKFNAYFRICFGLNLMSIILVDFFQILPGQKIYFLGIDNRWIFMYLPWMTFEYIIAISKGKNHKIPLLVFALCEFTLIYKWSVSAMVFFGVWILPLIIKKDIFKFPYLMYFSTLMLNIGIIVFKIQNNFKYLFENVFHKSLALSGRTFFWDKIILNLKDNWLLGVGMQNLEYDKNYFITSSPHNYPFFAAGHAHNSYMTVLYRYGFLGLINYIILWILPIHKLYVNRENKYMRVFFISFLCILLLSIFDTFDASGVYFIMAAAYGIDKISEEKENV